MKRLLLAFLTIAILPLSCVEQKQEESVSPLAEGTFFLSMNASLPDMPQVDSLSVEGATKAIAQYTVRIQWKEGDKLSVVNLTTGKILGGWLTANSTGFSGSLSGTVNVGDKLAYFYPAQDNTSEITFSGIHIDMSSQKGTLNDVPLCVYSITTANGDSFQNIKLTFSYLMCYLMIAMSDIPAGATIESVSLANVTNSFDLQINASHTGFDTTPIKGCIVLNPGNTASSKGARTIYMAVPASIKESSPRSFILATGTASFETTFSATALSNGIAYNANVAGFLTDDVAFKDAVLRAWCLTQFDSNGDGKLSMIEIASFGSFPNTLPDGILCFDELEFFYGLTSLPSFANQVNITNVTIPRQITAIPVGMFSGCSSLEVITMKPVTPPSLGSDALNGTPDNQIIIVPDDAVSAYTAAPGWADYADRIRAASNVSGSNVRFNTEGGSMGSDSVNISFE